MISLLSRLALAALATTALAADATSQPAAAPTTPDTSAAAAATAPAAPAAPAARVAPATELARKPAPVSPLPVAASTADETVAAAEASSSNVPGQCLGWSREQADIPSRYDDAATAWEHAVDRHVGDVTPPRGAAVYWLGGSSGHGHVAISVGHGRVRSSDAGGYGVVGTIQLRRLTREWGLQYAGWSDSINGYRIPGVADA